MRIKGKVSWYNHRDGFGQLIDDAGVRYFFDKSILLNISPEFIETGAKVEFSLNSKISKPLCATNLKLDRGARAATKSQQLSLFRTEVES